MKLTKTDFGPQGLLVLMEAPGINLLLYPNTTDRAIPTMWSGSKPWKWKMEGCVGSELIETTFNHEDGKPKEKSIVKMLKPFKNGIGEAIQLATAK
ncbi:hypothetical protein FUAX_28180 [Fulvitalea axinellae]|uniref:Uncharacterized protein n=1 Tax=Fulvitalea axinellae TaxID=1182444 RepID=A0AAU9CE31_9BACT|nr:hypothetical protein FUAX_28180 [Fulvitalea axinellae]